MPIVVSENNSSASALSDYERIRAKNIERNNARLRELGLISSREEEQSNALAWRRKTVQQQQKSKVAKAASATSNTTMITESTTTVSKKRKRDTAPTTSSRKSLRLQGKQPDGTNLPDECDGADDNINNDAYDDETEKERKARVLECRQVRIRNALEVSKEGAAKAAKENPTASYEHCLMRVRTMTEKGLANRVKSIERAAGKHCVIKMAIFKSCLQDEGLWDLAELASKALERLKALKPPVEDE